MTANKQTNIYLVRYRDENVYAVTSDYAVYEADDRVTILKGTDHPEDSMTWDNLTGYKTDIWSIVPMIFYYSECDEEG